MGNKLIKALVLVVMSWALTSYAKVQVPKQMGQARVDARQLRQAERIKNGVAKGRLTQAEADKLLARQTKIAAKEAKLAADGSLSKKDIKKLEKIQDKASKKIYAQKHDKQRNRMKRQKDRIALGVKGGELTEAEQKKLADARKAIKDFAKDAKADGKLTAFEKKTLRSMKDNSSEEIYKLKHNNRQPASTEVAAVDNSTAETAPVVVQTPVQVAGVQ